MRSLTKFLFKKKPTNGLADPQAIEDYHAHGYLGNLHLAMGNLAEAELEYSRAYSLLPSEEVRARLAEVRKRRAAARSFDRSTSATRAA
jgi:hypothetical protein